MKNNQLILIACIYSVFMPICMDLYVAALPSISSNLNISPAHASDLTFYMLYGVAISMLFYGPLSDMFGRRKIILFSLIISALGALTTACAHNQDFLIGGRVLTGIGSGGAPVIARCIISDKIHDRVKFTQAISWYAMAGTMSPALAPIIGGLIYISLGWRAIFIFLFIFTLAVFFISYYYLVETIERRSDIAIWATFKNYWSLLKDRTFITYSVIAGLCFSYNIFYYAVSAFLYQNYFTFTTLQNSTLYWISALCIILGGRLLQKLIIKGNKYKIIWFATLIFTFNSLLILIFAICHLKSSLLFISLICISGITYGIMSPAFLSEGLVHLKEKLGTAGALQAFLRVQIAVLVGILGTGEHNISMLKFASVLFIVSIIILALLLYIRRHVKI